MQKVFNMTCKI